ncbi:CoxG family protein [Acidimangrovimonas pyrenivorans]|uniref:CoxG family protein n=1 Tax=Acidimangrovimonas pyrenivorans TaxID=2030798 RepID=A0ABV7AIU8_9RHOB
METTDEITGKRGIQARPETVWSALHDAACLETCLPGCLRVTGDAESGFSAKFGHTVRGMPVRLNADVTVTEIAPGKSARIAIDGGNTLTGRAGAEIEIELVPVKAGTRLVYSARPHAGSGLLKLAGLPLDALGDRLAQGFTRNLKTYLEQKRGG